MHQAVKQWADESLPSRERGLKSDGGQSGQTLPESLPSRERGLKYPVHDRRPRQAASLPSREHGLKSTQSAALVTTRNVALFTGAWIEIVGVHCANAALSVAPFTGAWIEIPGRWAPCRCGWHRSLHGSVD